MSKAQEQEAYRRITAMTDPLEIARELTEQIRIQSMTEPIPRGFPVATYYDGDLNWESHYLKSDYFLALFYRETLTEHPDPYTEPGLKHCQAWIFKYDRHHAKLGIEARNAEIGDRSFSQIAHRLATD
ncbi:unnamed protein product [marine sediment metagenome]|uniref:Uncharacterized protein n=1 Tax=marine sediment metagenome TaxID=412755 RepID=X1RHA5_9ZZZZ